MSGNKITKAVFPVAGMGTRFDCGSKSGFIAATLDQAAEDPELNQYKQSAHANG